MVKGKKRFVTRTFVEKQFYFSLLQSEKHFLALSQAVNDCPALSCFSLESGSRCPCGLQPPVPPLRAILRAVTLERLACPPPGASPLRDQTPLLLCPAMAGRFFTTSIICEAPFTDRPLDKLIKGKGEKKQERSTEKCKMRNQ